MFCVLINLINMRVQTHTRLQGLFIGVMAVQIVLYKFYAVQIVFSIPLP